MKIKYDDAVSAAKSITELAIQQNLIVASTSTEETAKEIAAFYDTIVSKLCGIND